MTKPDSFKNLKEVLNLEYSLIPNLFEIIMCLIVNAEIINALNSLHKSPVSIDY